jgi:hypothetical protein
MSERIGSDNDPQQQLKAAIAERVIERLGWLAEAATAVGGEGATVESVFERPPEVRADAPEPDWSPEQVEKVREVAHRLGYGTEQTVPSGLTGGVRIAEGGLAWKIAAEAAALEAENNHSTIIFAGSPNRTLREDEQVFLHNIFNEELDREATEYDLAYFFARRQATKSVNKPPIALSFGYELTEGFPTIQGEETWQLIHVGETKEGQSVQLLRVDQIDNTELGTEAKKPTPDSARLIGFIADVLSMQGNDESPIGLVTSNAYASRQIDAVRASLSHNRQVGVVMYGRATMAEVMLLEMKPDTPLNQLPGDLRVTYDKLIQLQQELQNA